MRPIAMPRTPCCACFAAAQILLINGLNAGSRSRKELLDRLAPGMRLFNPLCLLPDGGAGPAGGSSLLQAAVAAADAPRGQMPAPQLPLDEESLASLGWTVALPAGAAVPSLQVYGGGGGGGSSCCALPAVRIQVPEGALLAMEMGSVPAAGTAQQPAQPALPEQPADSQATVASAGAAAGLLRNSVQRSPEVAQQPLQPPQWLPVQRGQLQPAAAGAQARLGGASGIGWGQQQQQQQEDSQEEMEDDLPEQPEQLAPPAWLAAGIASVGESSQGSADAVAGQQLLGRRQVESARHACMLACLLACMERDWCTAHWTSALNTSTSPASGCHGPTCPPPTCPPARPSVCLSACPLPCPLPRGPPAGWPLCCWKTLSRATPEASQTLWRRGCRRGSEWAAGPPTSTLPALPPICPVAHALHALHALRAQAGLLCRHYTVVCLLPACLPGSPQ